LALHGIRVSYSVNPPAKKVYSELSNHEQANVPQHHREGEAVVFDPPENQKEAARRRREDEQHEFARSQVKTNTKLAWFTGALVLATFCTIGVGIWQARIYGGQLGAMRGQLDQMNKQFPEIKKSADAATSTAQTSALTMQLDERARLDIKYPAIQMNVGSRISVPLIIENTGKTEAKELRGTIAVYITEAGAIPDFTYVRGYYSWNSGYLPQGTPAVTYWNVLDRKTRNDVILTGPMNDAIRSGKEVVTIQGRIEYDDIFHVHHWVTFCQQGAGYTNGMAGGPLTNSAIHVSFPRR
jgi:hypothetical protein